jgi:phenylpyruvate tautomerase PptA (4-oxalocrotonate tautomerase family)
MPLADIQRLQDVFNDAQKQEMIDRVTETMIGIEGEAVRGVAWARVQDVARLQSFLRDLLQLVSTDGHRLSLVRRSLGPDFGL